MGGHDSHKSHNRSRRPSKNRSGHHGSRRHGETKKPPAALAVNPSAESAHSSAGKATPSAEKASPSAERVSLSAGKSSPGAGRASRSAGRASRVNFDADDADDMIELDKLEDRKPKKDKHEAQVTYREPIFANSLINSFVPYRIIMQFIFRFPFHIDRSTFDGSYTFHYKPFHPIAIGFALTSIIVFVQTILLCVNLIGLLLNYPHNVYHTTHQLKMPSGSTKLVNVTDSQIRAQELYLFQRSVVPVLVLISCAVCAVVGNVCLFIRREFIGLYYTFWTTTLEVMRIDAANGVRQVMTGFMVMYSVFVVLIIIFAFVQIAPVTTGARTVFTILTCRIFQFNNDKWGATHLHPQFKIIRGVLSVVIIYIFVSSKSCIILYYWTSKLLVNAFAVWNHRLERVLHEGESENSRHLKVANRTGYDHLFNDHVCLLDLIEGADRLFANILESYYATQIITICFEFFHAWRSLQSAEEFPGGRRYDAIVMFLYTIHTTIFLFVVSYTAAKVSEEAMDGLEVVRRKGSLGRQDELELYFQLSMYVSYSGHFDTTLSGGGYFNIDKGFLVGLVGTIISYFIILFQFTPSLVFQDNVLIEEFRKYPEFSEDLLLDLGEGSSNPFEQGKTFIALEMNSLAGNPRSNQGVDTWDFMDQYEFTQYLNISY